MQSTPPEELAQKCFNAKNCVAFAYMYAKYASGKVFVLHGFMVSGQVPGGFGGAQPPQLDARATVRSPESSSIYIYIYD